MAIKERLTCIITTEAVMCILHCRKYQLHNCDRNSHLHSYDKNCRPHICCRNFHLCMCCRIFELDNCNRSSHLHNCNRKIHQHTSNKVPPQNLHKFNRLCHLHNCHNCHFHLQKWRQSEILLVAIKKLGEWVSAKFKANSFSTPCIT